MKVILFVAFSLLSMNFLFTQQQSGYDSIYLQVDELNIENFPTVEIPNHTFGYFRCKIAANRASKTYVFESRAISSNSESDFDLYDSRKKLLFIGLI